MGPIRVVQWNVSFRSKAESIGTFLEEVLLDEGSTIICLQEVLQGTYRRLIQRLAPSSAVYSLDYRVPGKHEGKNRKMGLAVLVFNADITESGLLDRTVFPERTLWCHIEAADRKLRVLSFHSLTGVGYRHSKVANFAAIADYLDSDRDLDFLCFDANEPKTDSLRTEDIEFWSVGGNRRSGRKAALIMGTEKVHSLEDTFRRHSREKFQIDSVRLPVTHYTGGVPRRYDYVFASPRWEVLNIAHPLQESLNASSDHSAVVVDLGEILNDC